MAKIMPGSPAQDTALDFAAFLALHPTLRFWQGLLAWYNLRHPDRRTDAIWIGKRENALGNTVVSTEHVDTFYFEEEG